MVCPPGCLPAGLPRHFLTWSGSGLAACPKAQGRFDPSFTQLPTRPLNKQEQAGTPIFPLPCHSSFPVTSPQGSTGPAPSVGLDSHDLASGQCTDRTYLLFLLKQGKALPSLGSRRLGNVKGLGLASGSCDTRPVLLTSLSLSVS